jgi:hypothetical protein
MEECWASPVAQNKPDVQTARTCQGTANDFEPIRPGEQGIILHRRRASYTGNPQFLNKGQHVMANSRLVLRLWVAVGFHRLCSRGGLSASGLILTCTRPAASILSRSAFGVGGRHAPVRVSLFSLQKGILYGFDGFRIREGQSQVPEMRRQKGGTTLGGLLCDHLEEKLTR